MNKMQLTPAQQAAVKEISHHLQIIACAGSGKTEVISRRIAFILQYNPACKPENIVAFTFTNKAAKSMKERIFHNLTDSENLYAYEDLDSMIVSTIHSFCFHLLQNYCPEYQNVQLLDTVKSHLFIERYSNDCGLPDLGLKPHSQGIRLFLDCTSKMADDYENRYSWSEEQRIAFDKYRDCLRKHGFLDFTLLIFETLQQLQSVPAMMNALRQIHYLVVDEYQDIDDMQERLIHTIALAGANICVVGDDDQTIYQFRGSNADNMISFVDRYPGTVQIRLEKNFRCAPAIVDVADKVIRGNQNRLAKQMISAAEVGNGHVEALGFSSQDEEFADIANRIASLHQSGTAYSDIAILVRKGKFVKSVCSALDQHSIPYTADCAEYFFAGKYFPKFLETLNIITDIDKAKLYDCWKGLIDDSTFASGFKYLRSVARSGGDAKRYPLNAVLNHFLTQIGFLPTDDRIKTDAASAIELILRDYDTVYGDWQLTARINGLLQFLNHDAAEEYKYHAFNTKEASDSVQVMTVHKAKGLEFDTVFIPELESREFPVLNQGGQKYWHILGGTFEKRKDRYQSNIDDERKLFYVAVTRAKKELYLCYQHSKNRVSEFVKEAANSMYLLYDPDDFNYEDYEGASLSQEARRLVMDYYGTAMHSGMFAAGGDLVAAQQMSDAQIVAEARKLGLL